MMTCPHDLGEMETACADGLCPLCLQARLREMERQVRDGYKAYRDQVAADTTRLLREVVAAWRSGVPGAIVPVIQKINDALAAAQPKEKP